MTAEYEPNDTERALAFADIKAWAESLGEDDYHPMIVVDIVDKTFTPQEFVKDMQEGTALADALLDVVVIRAREQGMAPVEYFKKLAKTSTGKIVRGEFWLEGGQR